MKIPFKLRYVWMFITERCNLDCTYCFYKERDMKTTSTVEQLKGLLKDIPVSEYTANQVKQAIVGRGHAAKTQVQHMVKILLNLTETPQEDAADALAIALCHANTSKTMIALKTTASERYPAEVLKSIRGRRKKRFTL